MDGADRPGVVVVLVVLTWPGALPDLTVLVVRVCPGTVCRVLCPGAVAVPFVDFEWVEVVPPPCVVP
ncbi:MAG TPA: hypothetical protein VG223_17730, partial [Solirubrobacteraceae bacterium]|nr:hypothetical protein [Solirubrobacteraceae bacterium]